MTGPAVAWYYRYFSLCAEPCRSIEEAVSYLRYGNDNGDLSVVGIETADEYIDKPHKHPYWKQLDAIEDEERKLWAAQPKPNMRKVIGPDGKDTATVHPDDAELIASILGKNRVST